MGNIIENNRNKILCIFPWAASAGNEWNAKLSGTQMLAHKMWVCMQFIAYYRSSAESNSGKIYASLQPCEKNSVRSEQAISEQETVEWTGKTQHPGYINVHL